VPFKQRAGRLDEALDILRRLWTADEPLDYEGRYYHLHDLVCLPKPVQRPHPKIVVGGVWHGSLIGRPHLTAEQEWSERAITRIAKYGDGWITFSTIPVARAAEILAEGVARVKARAAELGRQITDDEFLLVGETGFITIADSRERALEESERCYAARVARGFHQSRGNPSLETHLATGVAGTPEDVAEFLRQWLAVKKTVPSLKRLQLNFGSLTQLAQIRKFHREVVPLIRQELQEAR
jgi:alkanesulfonate monooxygenase SsuD/methylene tetrahydromethanopterin reductase-like flavin-dependent oxidoreductase (luciferase family)